MKDKFNQYKHVLLLLYFPIYLAAFRYLENITPNNLHIIGCPIDRYIPFVEYFIVPYLFWFIYIGGAGIYFLFCEKETFCRMMYFGMIGMTIFLLVSWAYPNGLSIRPEAFARDNLFVDLTRYVYSVDTPTNVLPSIHVFNSIAVHIAVCGSERLKNNKWVRPLSLVIAVMIILSTMFVKQHSLVDVISGMVLAYLAYELVYGGKAVQIWNSMSVTKYRKSGQLEK